MDGTACLDAWIRELRARLERGDLAELGPIDLGDGSDILTGERIVRIMLVDLDDLDAQIRDGTLSPTDPRWRRLLDDFRRLRDQIG